MKHAAINFKNLFTYFFYKEKKTLLSYKHRNIRLIWILKNVYIKKLFLSRLALMRTFTRRKFGEAFKLKNIFVRFFIKKSFL